MNTSVPLRHDAADGSAIELFIRRFPATDPASRRGEIWLVAGGPGEPGASFHPFLPTFRKAFPNHDLVLPDHRGTGGSDRLCPEQEAIDSPDGVALASEEWGPCIGALHAEPDRVAAFNITQAAHDLSALLDRYRGDGEVLLYSVSYGTQLALRMLQVAPAALDGLILDGLVPPENAPQWDLSRRTAVVDEVGRAFLGQAEVAAYQRLLDASGAEAAWREHVPGGDLRRLFGALLNFPELRARIPDIVSELSHGDDTALRTTIDDLQTRTEDLTRHPLSPPSLPLVMSISASENNERRDLSRETVEAEEEAALFTSPIPGFLVDSPVPRYERDSWFGGTPASLPRTLVMHGTLDPNTPYAGAQAHARILSRAGELTFSTIHDGAHLLAYAAPACFAEVASAFVEEARVPESCTERNESRDRCAYDEDALMSLDEAAFDQDLPDGGWRKIGNIPGCEVAAAELIAAYRVRHPGSSSTVAWHEGQMLASAGLNEQAIPALESARKDPAQDLGGWNHYVDATIAFLSGDRRALERARDRLAAVPYDERPGLPPLVNGYVELPTQPDHPPMRMRWPPNINVVEGFVNCFGKSYNEAYGTACRPDRP